MGDFDDKYTEREVLRITGLSRTRLYYLRRGQHQRGKGDNDREYFIKPKLEAGLHWGYDPITGRLYYTTAALQLIGEKKIPHSTFKKGQSNVKRSKAGGRRRKLPPGYKFPRSGSGTY